MVLCVRLQDCVAALALHFQGAEEGDGLLTPAHLLVLVEEALEADPPQPDKGQLHCVAWELRELRRIRARLLQATGQEALAQQAAADLADTFESPLIQARDWTEDKLVLLTLQLVMVGDFFQAAALYFPPSGDAPSSFSSSLAREMHLEAGESSLEKARGLCRQALAGTGWAGPLLPRARVLLYLGEEERVQALPALLQAAALAGGGGDASTPVMDELSDWLLRAGPDAGPDDRLAAAEALALQLQLSATVDDKESWYRVARALILGARWADARAALERCLAATKGPSYAGDALDAAALLLDVLAAAQLGEEAAEERLVDVTVGALAVQEPETSREQAGLLRYLQQATLQSLATARSLAGPPEFLSRVMMGLAERGRGDSARAAQLTNVLSLRGRVAIQAGKVSEGLDALRRALDTVPGVDDAHLVCLLIVAIARAGSDSGAAAQAEASQALEQAGAMQEVVLPDTAHMCRYIMDSLRLLLRLTGPSVTAPLTTADLDHVLQAHGAEGFVGFLDMMRLAADAARAQEGGVQRVRLLKAVEQAAGHLRASAPADIDFCYGGNALLDLAVEGAPARACDRLLAAVQAFGCDLAGEPAVLTNALVDVFNAMDELPIPLEPPAQRQVLSAIASAFDGMPAASAPALASILLQLAEVQEPTEAEQSLRRALAVLEDPEVDAAAAEPLKQAIVQALQGGMSDAFVITSI